MSMEGMEVAVDGRTPKVLHLLRLRMAIWLMEETEVDEGLTDHEGSKLPLLPLVPLVSLVVKKAWAVGIRGYQRRIRYASRN